MRSFSFRHRATVQRLGWLWGLAGDPGKRRLRLTGVGQASQPTPKLKPSTASRRTTSLPAARRLRPSGRPHSTADPPTDLCPWAPSAGLLFCKVLRAAALPAGRLPRVAPAPPAPRLPEGLSVDRGPLARWALFPAGQASLARHRSAGREGLFVDIKEWQSKPAWESYEASLLAKGWQPNWDPELSGGSGRSTCGAAGAAR